MSVRGLARCSALKIVEFARIFLLNDFVDFEPLYEHHEPLKVRPSYESLDNPSQIVSLNIFLIEYAFYEMEFTF